jgi:F5/8 type C domain
LLGLVITMLYNEPYTVRGGLPMLRKQVVPKRPASPAAFEGEIPVAEVATVQVTSEQADHPIDHAFDGSRGPGGTRWVADSPGEQTVTLLFDRPQTIRQIVLEVEERAVSRTQELAVSVSSDGGATYRELVRQEFNFSPPGTSFERERWSVPAGSVTHLRLEIKPDKGGQVGLATLTALILA